MANKRIGILTGGGDVPGLNSVIKSVVYSATGENGFEVIGFRRGWKGLTHLAPDGSTDAEYVLPLDRQNTRTVDREGGTFLHTSRTNPSKMKLDGMPEYLRKRSEKMKEVKPGVVDITPMVLENLQRLKVDYLVAIGGDDTLSYAAVLDKAGFPVVAVPKTMDNDVQNTEYCIGFSTALTRAVEAIQRQRTTIGSHERIGIFRIFGRDAGFTALYTAYVTSIRCCIPEVEFDLEHLCQILLNDRENNPSRYSLVVLSEGAVWAGHKVIEYGEADAFGHKKKANIGEQLSDELKKRSRQETVVSDLTYDLRSGDPDFLDKMIATTFANMAFECIASNTHGKMMAIRNGCYAVADIPDPKLGARKVDVANMYNIDRFRPNYSHKQGLPIFLTKV
ncbi:MAG TPA: 6-phosphofructokinase [Tepidisphaeraceae bacterium]|nr:6-phosphofructokinase [Tepidisphaeraceae bacterium]